MPKHLLKTLLFMLCIGFMPSSYASAPAESAPAEESANPLDEAMGATETEVGYYELRPDITTNLSTTPKSKRLHYVRLKLAIMVSDSNDIPKLEEKEALIRDTVVTVIGAKDYTTAKSPAFRDQIRNEIRERLSEVLFEKDSKNIIEDILILNYMYQ